MDSRGDVQSVSNAGYNRIRFSSSKVARAVADQESTRIEQLKNGLTLIGQYVPGVRSVAFTLLLPGGSALDPPGRWGVANIAAELVFRGAGERDSRALQNELDRLGVVKSITVGREQTTFSGATLGDNLEPALELYADALLRPHLAEEQFQATRALVLQEIQTMEEDPKSRVSIELTWRHWPEPFGAPPIGTRESVTSMTYDDVRAYWEGNYTPSDAILAVAGHFEWSRLRDAVQRLFGEWHGDRPQLRIGKRRDDRRTHLRQETSQTHLAIACDTVPFDHPDYYGIRMAIAVLSSGASSRLFTELREKRGLCYAVWASYSFLRITGAVFGYVGTVPQKADEALELYLHQLRTVGDNLTDEEVERARAGIKSSLIMGQESTSARAQMAAGDWFYLGRVRPLEEIQRHLDELSVQSIRECLARHPFEDFTIVSLGPEAPRLLRAEATE